MTDNESAGRLDRSDPAYTLFDGADGLIIASGTTIDDWIGLFSFANSSASMTLEDGTIVGGLTDLVNAPNVIGSDPREIITIGTPGAPSVATVSEDAYLEGSLLRFEVFGNGTNDALDGASAGTLQLGETGLNVGGTPFPAVVEIELNYGPAIGDSWDLFRHWGTVDAQQMELSLVSNGFSLPANSLLEFSVVDGGTTGRVTVVPLDGTPPVLTLNGADPLLLECPEPFVDPGATAIDDVDGDLSGSIVVTGAVDPTILGDHVLTYSVTDAAGNHASITRTVTVQDTTPPTLVCPDVPTVVADENCQAVVPDLAGPAVATDACSAVVVAQAPAAGEIVGLGSHAITVTATDAAGNSTSCEVELVVVDETPPQITTCPEAVTLDADANCQAGIPDLAASTVATDCNGPVVVTQSPVAETVVGLGTHAVVITAEDQAGNTAACTVSVTVRDVTPPVVTITTPASGLLAEVSAPIGLSGSFVECNQSGAVSAKWIVESATVPKTEIPGGVSGSTVLNLVQFDEPGVYSITLEVTDAAGNTGSASTVLNDLPAFVVIYDPSGGFVTGGGWVWSPVGALHPGLEEFEAVEGKASFGLVAKYKKGASEPIGQTEFQFKAGNLNFHSTSYQWLVVAGARAQFKGWGTINGAGAYRFMITAIDGRVSGGGGVDRFRMKIWDEVTGSVIYDNQAGAGDNDDLDVATALQGGNIVVHK